VLQSSRAEPCLAHGPRRHEAERRHARAKRSGSLRDETGGQFPSRDWATSPRISDRRFMYSITSGRSPHDIEPVRFAEKSRLKVLCTNLLEKKNTVLTKKTSWKIRIIKQANRDIIKQLGISRGFRISLTTSRLLVVPLLNLTPPSRSLDLAWTAC
jgi:hypothetical protein